MTPLLQTLLQPLLLSPGHTAPVTGPELMSPMSCMQVTEHLGQVPAPASPDSTQWPLSPHPFSSSPDRKGKLLLGVKESTVRQTPSPTRAVASDPCLLSTCDHLGRKHSTSPNFSHSPMSDGGPGQQQGRRWKFPFRCPEEKRDGALCILEKTSQGDTSLQQRGKATQLLSVYPKPFPIFSFDPMCQKLTFL